MDDGVGLLLVEQRVHRLAAAGQALLLHGHQIDGHDDAHDQVEAEEDADDADAEVAGDLAHAHGDAQRAGEIAHGQRGDVGAEDHRGAQHDHAAGYDDGPETVTL